MPAAPRFGQLPTSIEDLEIVRRAYAKQISAALGVTDKRIEDAFAQVKREFYLGPGPWPILRSWQNYVATPTDDPVYLYTDDVVGIQTERFVNNGQPSLHAHLLSQASPRHGEHVVHVGAGVGYYTAIMAQLVGLSGSVTAIEFDTELAKRAEVNFSAVPNVSVFQGDGGTIRFEHADVIYVNAGATRPASNWLDRLKDGGRLILPLTTNESFNNPDRSILHRQGAVFLITRLSDELHARWISPVAIFPCEGMRDEASEGALAVALEYGDYRQVRRLYRSDDVSIDRCWLRAPGWSLAYD